MRFDNLHTLENFCDIYNNSAEMVVTEAFANPLDEGASLIDVQLGITTTGEKIISFQDNGPGMNSSQFANYHVGSRSSKSKGSGIGFAGIGAKVYLAAFQKTKIITTTYDGNNTLASVMYLDGRTIMWEYVKPKIITKGTIYSVQLSDYDYDYLEKNLEEIVTESFNNALLNGLKVTINGKKIKPWTPKIVKQKTGIVNFNGRKLPYTFILAEDDIPHQRRNMEFHIIGKTITVRKPKFQLEMKSQYQNKIYVIINSLEMSDQLKTDKVSFKGAFAGQIYREIDKEMLKIAKKLGLMSNSKPTTHETNALTRALEEIFKRPEFSWLNPQAMRTITCGGRSTGSGGGSHSGSRHHSRTKPSTTPGTKRNKGSGLEIIWVFDEQDDRDGWIDLATNQPAVNLRHPLFLKVEKSISARNYHVARVIIAALVRFGAPKQNLTLDQAFDLQSKLLTEERDAVWL